MRHVAGVPRVPREQAQRVATASPATPLAGSRATGSSHGRGWRAHGRRRAGWACLPPGEELAGERGGREWRLVVVVAAAAMAAMAGAALAVVMAVVAVERRRRPRGGREDRRWCRSNHSFVSDTWV
jgi:hypothetical protein